MNVQEAIAKWQAMKPTLEAAGMVAPNVRMLMPTEWKRNIQLAIDAMPSLGFDAQPTLSTDPNGAIPALLTTAIDPTVIRVVFTPLNFAKILGEEKAGGWLDETRIFPVVEETGEVSSYGDWNPNGRAGVNINFPNFQSYLFQTFVRYGERQMERAGLAKINFVSELNISASGLLNRFQNLSYAFGLQGIQNYGIVNNPYLSAFLTPATKAAGGVTWFTASNQPNATANEVYNDILAVMEQLIVQTNGTLELDAAVTLAMPPTLAPALRFANQYGVYVEDLLKKGFPSMTVKTAPQYGTQSAKNQQGYSAAGNVMQVIATEIDNQKVAYAAFNEKLRWHKIIPEASAWSQKCTSGSWGTILRMPLGVAGMLGM